MSERFEDTTPTSAAFPPRELWLYDPIKEGRLEVVYDPHGLNLVDMNASLSLLLSTVETQESGYQFRSSYADLHHGEYEERDYPNLPHEAINPREFRNLACHKQIYPRVTHAWWHRVFETPKLATEEGMKLRLDAQRPITHFASSVNYANQLSHDTDNVFNFKEFRRQIGMRMWFYASLLDTLRAVPEDFRIVSVEDQAMDSIDDVIKVARMFKKHARPKTPLPLVLLSDLQQDTLTAA